MGSVAAGEAEAAEPARAIVGGELRTQALKHLAGIGAGGFLGGDADAGDFEAALTVAPVGFDVVRLDREPGQRVGRSDIDGDTHQGGACGGFVPLAGEQLLNLFGQLKFFLYWFLDEVHSLLDALVDSCNAERQWRCSHRTETVIRHQLAKGGAVRKGFDGFIEVLIGVGISGDQPTDFR